MHKKKVVPITGNPISAPQPLTPEPKEVGLKELMGIARRRAWVIGGITVFLTALAALILINITPRYSTHALIMVDPRTVNLDSVIAGLVGDPETVASEIEVIRSRRLAHKTIARLQLDTVPEFNPALRPPGLLGRWLGTRGADEGAAGTEIGELVYSGQRVEVVNEFQKRLRVEPKKQSRAISISFSSIDRLTTAQVVNTVADLYLLDQLESKYEAIQQATGWLNTQVSELRDKVEISENAVERYRRDSGLLEGKGVTLGDQQFTELSTQLILAQANLTETRARQRQIRQLLESSDGVESAGEVLGSALIQRLREQQATVQGQVAELSVEYGDRHPTMIKLRAEADDLNSKIATEIDKIVKGLDHEVEIARTRVRSLSGSLNRIKGQVAEANAAGVTLRALERDAQANRMLLETMLTQFMQTSSQSDMSSQQADARIISRADVPDSPTYPPTKPILALTAIGALFVGFIWAFASEILDKGFRGREEIEEFTGVPALGIVPRVKSLASGKKSAVAYIKDNPQSAYAESIRTLHSGILIAAGQIIPRTILVTSSQSGEGKTTTAVSLAEILALDNRRVAIVDADNRRPAVHSAYEVPVEPGLTGLLSGAIRLSDLVSTDRAEPGPVVIPAGKTVANAQSLFASAEMRNLLKKMEKEFDHIIIDSPPIMAVSDALILASRVESSVFVARWGYTSREAVKHGLQQLHKAGGKLAGVLLSMVDVKQYARYAYGDSGSYVGRLAHYYAHDTSESPRRSASTASQQPPG